MLAQESESGATSAIRVTGARTNFLKDISVDIPRRALVLVTGVSGSGKSSFVRDTLYAEALWRFSQLHRGARRPALNRPPVSDIQGLSFAVFAEYQAVHSPFSTLGTSTGIFQVLRKLYFRFAETECEDCASPIRVHRRREILACLRKLPQGTEILVSAPLGSFSAAAAEERIRELIRLGFTRVRYADQDYRAEFFEPNAVGDPGLSQMLSVLVDKIIVADSNSGRIRDAIELALSVGNGDISVEDAETGERHDFSERARCQTCGKEYAALAYESFSFYCPAGACTVCLGKSSDSVCDSCGGSRLLPRVAGLRFASRTLRTLLLAELPEVRDWSLATLAQVEAFPDATEYRDELREMIIMLNALIELGLGYLCLARGLSSLSTGELQRMYIARAVCLPVPGALCLLDEPSTGLHPLDVEVLADVLLRLRGVGYSIIAIDHDDILLSQADALLEFGPNAGVEGGEIIFQGSRDDYAERIRAAQPTSVQRSLSEGARTFCVLRNISERTLKVDAVSLPWNRLIGICGVSGSGKSTLLRQVLCAAFSAAGEKSGRILPGVVPLPSGGSVEIQEIVSSWTSLYIPSERNSPFSTVATLSGLAELLRDYFARSLDASVQGLHAKDFSFQSNRGRCNVCLGTGLDRESEFAFCEACSGSRFSKEVGLIKMRGRAYEDIFALSLDEIYPILGRVPRIAVILERLRELGLGYLTLGERVGRLSRGEVQRLRLARVLGYKKSNQGRVLLFDEPTRGLHTKEIERLIQLLQRFVREGASIVVVEHNPLFLAHCQYLLELGPAAGRYGGRIIAQGNFEEVLQAQESRIARFLGHYA